MTTLGPQKIVDVLVPVALDQAYSYRVPAGMELAPGDLVSVPLRARSATGVVWADDVTVRPGLHNRLKDVDDKLEIPPLKPELRKFVDWVSGYTLSPRGMVLRMALRMGEHLGPAREKVGVRLAGPHPKRMTAARNRVLAIAKKLGWRWGIPINFVLCFAFAFWPLPAIVISTTSLLVAAGIPKPLSAILSLVA
jgi:primosomal protein N' (replication factor Y)